MKTTPAITTVPDRSDPSARDAEGNLSNAARGEFGRAAVDLGTPDRGQNDDRTDAVDAIANIMHWLQCLDLDPRACLKAAAGHFDAERDTVEKQAIRILTEAGLDASLHHSGGGIWVAEVTSPTTPGRTCGSPTPKAGRAVRFWSAPTPSAQRRRDGLRTSPGPVRRSSSSPR